MKRVLIISVLMLTGAVCLAQTPTMNVYQSGGSLLQLPLSNIDSVLFETVPPPSTMVIHQTGGTINSIVVSSIDSITYTVFNTPPPPQNGDWLNPNISYGSVTDIDGNVYPTVVIGNQEWMAENLRTTRYSNGDPILHAPDSATWVSTLNNQSDSTGAWCYYNNDPSYNTPYGKLYKGYVAQDQRNACPTGWHVPDTAEFRVLAEYIGVAQQLCFSNGHKLKSEGSQWWSANVGGATNEFGFSAVGCGYREALATFSDISVPFAMFHSSTLWGPLQGLSYYAGLAYHHSEFCVGDNLFNISEYGRSIRCIRD